MYSSANSQREMKTNYRAFKLYFKSNSQATKGLKNRYNVCFLIWAWSVLMLKHFE